MSDRLKQIWSGFEEQTSKNLTGNGIQNINVPHRREWRTADDQFIPTEYEAPAERAFAALTYKLSQDEARYGKKAKKRSKSYKTKNASGATSHGVTYGDQPAHQGQHNYDGTTDPRQTLLASLRETDFRVLRHEINYTLHGAEHTEQILKKRNRKKIFGIF